MPNAAGGRARVRFKTARNGNKYITKPHSFAVVGVSEWKRRIVRFFVVSRAGLYKVPTEDALYEHFAANFEANTQKAFEELLEKDVIERKEIGTEVFYSVNPTKPKEIQSILDSVEETGEMMRPTSEETIGLKYEFTEKGSSRYRNRSFYYYYTSKENPDDWTVLIKTKAIPRPDKIHLGSVSDAGSRISMIWRAVCDVEKDGGGFFVRKWVENLDQEACGNNRRPSKAAFEIFVHMELLERVGNGRVKYRIKKNPSDL